MGKGKTAGGIVLIIFGVLIISGAGFSVFNSQQDSSQCPDLLESLSQSLSGETNENCGDLFYSQIGGLFGGIVGVAMVVMGIVIFATRSG